MNSSQIKEQIIKMVREYYQAKKHEDNLQRDLKKINYAGRVYDENEIINLIDASLEFWLTAGRYTQQFEETFKRFLKIKYCHTCNSGSSANLLAFMALTSPLLGERRIKPGDEVITVAASFPTTVTPIIQYGAIPVFLDITIPDYNIDCTLLEEALSDKTKAVMIAHTLGNPFNLEIVRDFCTRHNLWLVEDNCDALGSMYYIDGVWKYTGTIGDIGTSSFYPPHHITMGEGGAVYTQNPLLNKIVLSMRDWGRDCTCQSGMDNLCGNRFNQQFGQLPFGYDHKYVYSNFGYNLKITDMQGAVGLAQLEKLPSFIDRRRQNWQKIYNDLMEQSDLFVLPEPSKNSKPSWFGFLLTVRENAGFTRDEIVKYLELNNIQTRMLFAGNLIKHPCFDHLRENNIGYRCIGNLENTDKVMNNAFWIGVYPGLTEENLDYVLSKIRTFIKN